MPRPGIRNRGFEPDVRTERKSRNRGTQPRWEDSSAVVESLRRIGGTLAEILTNPSRSALVEAMDRNCIDFFMRYGRGPGGKVHEDRDLEWFVTGLPHPLFNGVMAARLAPRDVDLKIDAIVDEFRSRGLPLEWNVGALTRPRDLGRHLLAHGLEHTLEVSVMAMDLRELPESEELPEGLVISEARTRPDLETCVRIAHTAFGIPVVFAGRLAEIERGLDPDRRERARHFLGRFRGNPVATSELFLSAGVAGLYFVGTLPGEERRGFGRAMTLAALGAARDSGFRVGTLQATAAGFPIYRRLGFREYYRIGLYAAP